MSSSPNELFMHHVGMAVPDLEATIEWYERVFELEVRQRSTYPGFKAVFMQRDRILFEIFQADPPQPAEPVTPLTAADLTPAMLKLGFTHVAFGVPDVDAAWHLAVSRGATPILPPTDDGPGGARFGHVADLYQNVIEFHTPAFPPKE